MEQKEFKILLGAVILSVILSVGAMTLAAVTYQKTIVQGDQWGKPLAAPVVDLGPTSFAGFAGKAVTTKVDVDGQLKTFELRGHGLKNPRINYERVLDTDTETKKVIIDPNTQIYRIGESVDKKAPPVTIVSFDQFAIASTGETYIVSYAAGEGKTINAATPAHSIAIFNK